MKNNSHIVNKMQNIEIPMFNLKLEISKIAFRIFGIDIYWYALIIVFSIVSALLYCKKINGRYKIKFGTILDICIWAIPIGFICARLYYVIFNLNYFMQNPILILDIRDGGLAIYGGIIGGIITIAFYCNKHRINLLDLLDYISPAVALAQCIGRWGNFINAEAYGTETNLPWKMCIIENGIQKCVHPTFLYESICTLIIFILLSKLQKNRKFKGEILYLYLILYAFVRFWIEDIRIDSLMLYNLRISQILSMTIFILFLGIFTYSVIKNHIMSKKIKK